jgi:hypothetical protein
MYKFIKIISGKFNIYRLSHRRTLWSFATTISAPGYPCDSARGSRLRYSFVFCPFLSWNRTKLMAIFARWEDFEELSKSFSEARNATLVTTIPHRIIITNLIHYPFFTMRVTESVTAISVPTGIFIYVLMVFGSSSGKKTTGGPATFQRTIVKRRSPIVPQSSLPGLFLSMPR